MTVCKANGKEQGAWYEIKCVKDNILSKESKGEDAGFERQLLKSWAKCEGYEGANQALADCDKPCRHT